MDRLPLCGPVNDEQLITIPHAGILIDGEKIGVVGNFDDLNGSAVENIVSISSPSVALPGFIDAHTHCCFSGSRSADYALRMQGRSYQEIASLGGGILDTVQKTREASHEELIDAMLARMKQLLRLGVTTCECKSGYGLTVKDEIKLLEVINQVSKLQPIDVIPTCLAAHALPREFSSRSDYLTYLIENLFPVLRERPLANRMDIFIEEGAFTVEESRRYLQKAKDQGFSFCLHVDQFTRGASHLAADMHALSADHLEQANPEDCRKLRDAGVIAVVLPGASLGLGMPMAPARMMLDQGLAVAIASDWNPGSAPMGNILTQAAILGASETLTIAETLAGMTVRAAKALSLDNRGVIRPGMRADFIIFPCDNYREILYRQGSLLPSWVVIGGKLYSSPP